MIQTPNQKNLFCKFAFSLVILTLGGCYSSPHVERETFKDMWMGTVTIHPLTKVEKDNTPLFQIDPNKLYRIRLKRGGGSDGFNTVELDQNGIITLYRIDWAAKSSKEFVSFYEKATLKLPKESLSNILEAIEKNGLLKLYKRYSANVLDGTQWELLIEQGENKKSVWFDNHFPREIIQFAQFFDDVLSKNGLAQATWHHVANTDVGKNLR